MTYLNVHNKHHWVGHTLRLHTWTGHLLLHVNKTWRLWYALRFRWANSLTALGCTTSPISFLLSLVGTSLQNKNPISTSQLTYLVISKVESKLHKRKRVTCDFTNERVFIQDDVNNVSETFITMQKRKRCTSTRTTNMVPTSLIISYL